MSTSMRVCESVVSAGKRAVTGTPFSVAVSMLGSCESEFRCSIMGGTGESGLGDGDSDK